MAWLYQIYLFDRPIENEVVPYTAFLRLGRTNTYSGVLCGAATIYAEGREGHHISHSDAPIANAHHPQHILTDMAKDSPHAPPTPPPAYFPRQPTQLPDPATLFPLPAMHPPQHAIEAADLGWPNLEASDRNYNNTHNDNNTLDDDEDEDSRSAVAVRISTAVRISGNKNIVCLPADKVRYIAAAVTRSLHEGSAVPMIDEEGRPRPLRVEIEAGVEVRGEGNMLGAEQIVLRALNGKRREEDGDGEHEDQVRRRWRARSAGP